MQLMAQIHLYITFESVKAMRKKEIEKEIERRKRKLKDHKKLYQNNEAAVKDNIFRPILSSLGWNIEDPDEVVPEEKAGEGIADYCLKINKKRVLFIEVKNLSKDVEDHINQLARYCFDEGVDYGVITNGKKWLLLKSYENNKKLKDRKVWVIDIDDDKIEMVVTRLDFISRENVKNLRTLVKNQDLLAKAWQNAMESQELLVRPMYNVIKKRLSGKVPPSEIMDFVSVKISELIGPNVAMPNREPRVARDRVRSKNSNQVSTKYQNTKKPRMMRIRGSSIRIDNSYEILLETAKYLFNKGFLNKSDMPINASKGRSIVNSKPKHPTGREFTNGKTCLPGVYVETNNSRERTIQLAKILLKKACLSEKSLKIEY